MTTLREAADVHDAVTALITAYAMEQQPPVELLTSYLKAAKDPLTTAAHIALIAAGYATVALQKAAGGDPRNILAELHDVANERKSWGT
jgi:hypothetical protein